MSPVRHLRLPALVCAVALVATTPQLTSSPAGAAASREARPMSAQEGIGDPYFPNDGNEGYDVKHYAIDVRYRPETGRLTGTTRVRLTATERLEKFNLDLLVRAAAVSVRGERARFNQGRRELTVVPRSVIRKGRTVTVAVTYGGKPATLEHNGETPFERTPTGAIAVGEPHVAAWWFPSNDHPSDKATFDISLRVPATMEAISNGRLVSNRVVDGLGVWRWRPDKPMATYLAFAAFGDYDIEQGSSAVGRYLYAFEHGLGSRTKAAKRSLRLTPTITGWLQRRFGDYPFDDIGGVVPAVSLGYALENQTRPVYGRDMFTFGATPSLVVHEMAHQWFGDKVAVRQWRHIWLNEGFATYAEWLWRADKGGVRPQRLLMRNYNVFEPGNPYWRLPIGDPGPRRLFDYVVYERGAMTLQALRNRVGSHDFFRVLRTWVRDNSDGLGSVGGFRRLAERTSNENLDGFFRAWLYSGEKPARTAANGL